MAASSSDTVSQSTFSERTWVLQTLKNLETGNPFDQKIPISVCHVPTSISAVNPQAYAPQVMALGPYNYLRPELYHMERYKIEMIEGYWTPDQICLVVQKLKEIGPQVRACYHKYLDLEDETLSLMLAIDGLFLIYLLSKKLHRFADDASVFRDVMMLENQIPVLVLKEIANTIGLATNGDNDAGLFAMMWAFCESQSPFALRSDRKPEPEPDLNLKLLQEDKVLHLLDLLHEMITMRETATSEPALPPRLELSREESVALKIDPHNDEFLKNAKEILLTTEDIISIKPIKLISTLPWSKMSNLLGHSSGVKVVAAANPLVEEIDIPSVTKLSKLAGIVFAPIEGSLEVSFDSKIAMIYLPVITLTGNSEVILRNLVAYEMASRTNTSSYDNLVLAQYVDLMSGIVDTKEDASLLKRAGIIKGELSDSEVAELFNGMNKSSEKVYNGAAAEINGYYRRRPKVKAYRLVKKYVYESWRFLTVVSAVVLLLLMILQSVCSVYDCKRVIKW